MRYCLYLMILCFVGLMQSKQVYLSNDFGKVVHVRCLQGASEILLPMPRKQIYTLGGKEVTFNIFQKSLYLATLNDKKGSLLKVQMIVSNAIGSTPAVLENTIDVASQSSVDYINLSRLFEKQLFEKHHTSKL